MAKQVNRMKVGEISEPFMDQDEAREEYKIIKVKAYYPQHKANLDDDWMTFESMLKNQKQLEKWKNGSRRSKPILIYISTTLIKIPNSVTITG